MKKLAVLLMVLLSIAACSQNNKEPGSKSKSSVAPQPQNAQPETHPVPMPATPRPAEPIAQNVLDAYAGVELTVVTRATGAATVVEVPFNTAVAVEGTKLTVEVTQFYPDFVMSDKGYASRSTELNNAAARVKVMGGSLEFDGILFKEYPEVHTYDGSDYAIMLTGALAK